MRLFCRITDFRLVQFKINVIYLLLQFMFHWQKDRPKLETFFAELFLN